MRHAFLFRLVECFGKFVSCGGALFSDRGHEQSERNLARIVIFIAEGVELVSNHVHRRQQPLASNLACIIRDCIKEKLNPRFDVVVKDIRLEMCHSIVGDIDDIK